MMRASSMLGKGIHGLGKLRRDERLSLLRSSLVAVGVKAVGIVLVIGLSVLLARLLGAAEYGRFAFMQSIAFVLASLATLGFRESANRMVARYLVRRRDILLSRYILFGITVISLASLLLAALGHGIIVNFPSLGAKYGFSFPTMLGMVAGLALLSFLAPVLVALGWPVLSFAVENIGPRVILIAAILSLLAAGVQLTAAGALSFTIAGNFIPAAFLLAFAFSRFRLRVDLPRRFSVVARSSRAWFGMSLMMMTSPMISLVFSETSIIVLGASAPPAQVALYQVARRIAELATVCGAVATYLALPEIAKAHAQGRAADLQRTVNVANLLTVVPGLCVLLVLLIDGSDVLRVFGRPFLAAYTAMLILSAGRVADQLFGPVLEVMLMTGQHATASALNLGFAVVNIAVNCLVVPVWGQVGAATVTIGVTLVWKACLYAALRTRHTVEPCLAVRLVQRLASDFAHRVLTVSR